MIQLSQHFNLNEFLSPGDTPPDATVIGNLTRLANALELVRAYWITIGLTTDAEGMVIDSGYRSPAHNADPSVRGAKGSQHVKGNAADVRLPTLRESDHQIRGGAEATHVPAIGGIGFYHDESCLHLDTRPRVGGKITHWYQDEHGSYVPTPQWLIDSLDAAGAVDLL